MVSSYFAGVFDTKVVDHKGKKDIFSGMLPKGRSLRNGGVAKI